MSEFWYGSWPICKGLTRIKEEDCAPETYYINRGTHCLAQKDGFFAKKLFKGSCPRYMVYTGQDKEESPICKNVVSFQIT